MCGIAGIVSFGSDYLDQGILKRMSDAIAHRGPDGHGYWVEGGVGFGHRRLAIRDLSAAGNQPMHSSDDRFVIVFNGEIYNDRELKRLLTREAGVRFYTDCDTELIAPALSHWGESALLRFEGMFAFAIWDKQDRKLILARDPIGIKPLYYSISDDTIAFASEVKGVIPFCKSLDLDQDALRRYLAQGHTGPDKSLISAIKPLPPGSVAVYSSDGMQIKRYWHPVRTAEYHSIDDALTDFQPLFDKVVQDHLISDVPLGVLLSGGIDSALIAKSLKGLNGVRTFTGRFSQIQYDESVVATAVASEYGHTHTNVDFEDDEGIEARFIRISGIVDGQLADSSALAFYAVCREARRHVKVVLTGDGADEFFGGYDTYRASIYANILAKILPAGAFTMLAGYFSRAVARDEGPPSRDEKLQRLFQGLSINPDFPHAQWRRYMTPEQEQMVFSPASLTSGQDALYSYSQAAGYNGNILDRCLLADQNYYLPSDMLVKADMMSMAHGLEVRVPFLDRRIMDFAGKLGAGLLVPKFGNSKQVLRKSLGTLENVPGLEKLPKRGFNTPVAYLLRHQLKDLGEFLLVENPDILGRYINPEGVRKLWRQHQESHANNGYALWALLTLAVWCRNFNQ